MKYIKTVLLLLIPILGIAQCKTTNIIYSISSGYQNGFAISAEAGFWQVKKSFQASIGVMAYDVEMAKTVDGKIELYKQMVADPFIRAGMKLMNKSSMIIVISGFASVRGVVGITCRSFYQIGPSTLAGIQLGQSNKGPIIKADFVFSLSR